MLIINNNIHNINLELLRSTNKILLSYTFLSIYGLPFCILYTKKLLKISSILQVALEINNEQATATLAIIDNFPNLIVNQELEYELNIIKRNCCSYSNIFTSIKIFKKAFNS